MDCVTILAQSVETAGPEAAEEAIVPMDLFWKQITSLGLLEAVTFISFGAVWLFYGWRVFKILVVISFALVGLLLGIAISSRIIGWNNQLVGGLIGMALLAVLSVPLMRWAVSILGALAGAVLVMGVWYAFQLTEKYIWAGALIGLVAGGMISFIIFKIAVILFSSLGGSVLMVVGVLALLYLYPPTTKQVEQILFAKRWFLPVMTMVPTLVGVIVQNRLVKGSKDWAL